MELKNNFIAGGMNKDFDVRLVPQGEYIDAENILVSNSEGSEVGSVQNSFGVDKLTNLNLPNDAVTIGSVSDESNECLYWLVTSSIGNFIYEYDERNNGSITTILSDTRPVGQNVLNFSSQYKVTGINVIYNSFNREKLLIWTDNLNPIRCINIKRAKGYAVNGFESKDISLYKRPPFQAPNCTPTISLDSNENNIKERFLSFAYRYKYLDGEYSAVSSFTNPQFFPGAFNLDVSAQENTGMINTFNAVNIEFNTGDKNVTDIQLLFKESDSSVIYVIENFNKKDEYWNNNANKTFLFSNNKIYSILPEDEVNRLFDNVPLVAKSQEFIGNRLIYGNYVEGRDLTGVNGLPVNVNYQVDFVAEDLNNSQISNSLENAAIDNVSQKDILSLDFSGLELKKGSILNINFISKSNAPFAGNYNCSLSYYLPEDYANAAELASSLDFQQWITYGASSNFANFDTHSVPPQHEITSYPFKYGSFQILTSVDVDIIRIKIPYIRYKVDLTPSNPNDNDDPQYYDIVPEFFEILDATVFCSLSIQNIYSSCKSNRSYECGIVYLDEEGRYSTVITNPSNTVFIPVENSDTKNTLKLEIRHNAPKWANRYKIFVKDNKLEYETIYGTICYKDGNFLWVKLEGTNKNKVKEGDSLIVKTDSYGPLDELVKTTVLELKQQNENFITDNIDANDNAIYEQPGFYMKIRVNNFNVASDGVNTRVFNGVAHGNNSYQAFTDVFGYYDNNGTFVPYKLNAGSKVTINIRCHRDNDFFGNGGFDDQYNRTYKVQGNYNSVRDWFYSEVQSLINISPSIHYFMTPTQFWVQSTNNSVWTTDNDIWNEVSFTIVFAGDTLIFETDPIDKSSEIFYETQDTYLIQGNNHLGRIDVNENDVNQNYATSSPAIIHLSFFNCFSQGNGVESYIIKDAFNKNKLSATTRPNAAELDGYKQKRNIASLTYSGAFDESTNYNSLNEFNLSRANYKDLDDKYGSIQKLHSRDTDLIVFQEDKVHRILYNKNVLVDAVGGGQITSVETVLGQEVAFAGEWGIGTDPESFAFYANSLYFTDAPKGAVLRLSTDGIEPISRYSMKDWFRDTLRTNNNKFKFGGFDPLYDEYILSFSDETIISPENEIICGQTLEKLSIPAESEFNFYSKIGDKPGDFKINYNLSEDEKLTLELNFNNNTESASIQGHGVLSISKEEYGNLITGKIINTNNYEVNTSLAVDCPETPEMDVYTLVVNDTEDANLMMINKYSWFNTQYGYGGESSASEVFSYNGITRFHLESGFEGDNEIPLNNSQIRVSSIKQSGEFTACNRIGYVVTSNVLDAQQILNQATYPSVVNNGNEKFIEFTFTRTAGQKLYIVWDYIDSVISDAPETLLQIVNGGNVTYNALNLVQAESPYTITIQTEPQHGDVVINGDNLIYTHDATDTFTDFYIYRVSHNGCYRDIKVNILIDPAIPPCYGYKIWTDSGYVQAIYVDCDGNQQTISVDGANASGYTESFFCAREILSGGAQFLGDCQ